MTKVLNILSSKNKMFSEIEYKEVLAQIRKSFSNPGPILFCLFVFISNEVEISEYRETKNEFSG